MTNAELVALLREMREDLALAHADLDALRQTRKMSTLTDRIDAALAEHDAVSPSEEKVEWLSLCDGQENRLRLADGTRLYACSHGDGHWGWSVNRPSSYGYANTLDEAKSAAIAAARGMR